MASNNSFDVSTGYEAQEVDNAVNQTNKEIGTRYDFRGIDFEIVFENASHVINLKAPDEYKLNAIWEVLLGKMVKRGVPVKNLHRQDMDTASGGTVRQAVKLQDGIDGDTAKKIVKKIKDQKFKKVQASIQSDQVRVTSPSRDALQEVITFLKGEDFDIELQFINFR